MIPMCWPLRRLLGRGAAFAAAALFAFGPSYLYFGALRPRGHLRRRDHARPAWSRSGATSTGRASTTRRSSAPLLAASFATKETTFITVFVMGSFFLFSFAIPAWRAAARSRALKRAGLGGLGLVPGRLRGRLHAALHDVPDPPRRALGRHLHGPEVLARPARRGPRRRAVAVLHRRADVTIEWPALILGAIGAVSLWRRNTLLRGVPDLGLLRLADRLLVGGREVRLARPAPAAAAVLLAGVGLQAIWQARGALRWRRPRGRRGRAVLRRRSPRGGSTSTAAPTRARCSSPPSPPSTSRTSPTRSRRSPTAAARASRR